MLCRNFSHQNWCDFHLHHQYKTINGRDSFQLFVGVFDTCVVWFLLVLPSEINSVANMTSLRAIDVDTSYHSCESFSLISFNINLKKKITRSGKNMLTNPWWRRWRCRRTWMWRSWWRRRWGRPACSCCWSGCTRSRRSGRRRQGLRKSCSVEFGLGFEFQFWQICPNFSCKSDHDSNKANSTDEFISIPSEKKICVPASSHTTGSANLSHCKKKGCLVTSTGLVGYSDTAYSDKLLIVTLLAFPKWLVC